MSGAHVIAEWEPARDYLSTGEDRRRYDMGEVGGM
jgi:hypothetical protein